MLMSTRSVFLLRRIHVGHPLLLRRPRLLKTTSKFTSSSSSSSRTYSSSSSNDDDLLLVKTDLDEGTGIATMTLNRPPANSLSLEMCQAISESIKTAEANKQMQAMVISSNLSSIFSAGLDLTELYDPDPKRLPEFWRSFQNLYLDLYGSRLSTIAAINGHAPAAGCMIALSCDYRIMMSSSSSSSGGKVITPTIGLNESKVGIVAPPWLKQQYVDTIGFRKAELALSLGTLFNPQQALEIGLVDEVIDNIDGTADVNVVEIAKQGAIENWIPIPSQARVLTKESTRGPKIKDMIKDQDLDLEQFCTIISNKYVQKSLGLYLEQLTKKAKQKKK